jgi:hypothetical protein
LELCWDLISVQVRCILVYQFMQHRHANLTPSSRRNGGSKFLVSFTLLEPSAFKILHEIREESCIRPNFRWTISQPKARQVGVRRWARVGACGGGDGGRWRPPCFSGPAFVVGRVPGTRRAPPCHGRDHASGFRRRSRSAASIATLLDACASSAASCLVARFDLWFSSVD